MIPLIDVMLVLLVIFIITAPLLTHAVKIDLPKASQHAQPHAARSHRGRDRRARHAVLERRRRVDRANSRSASTPPAGTRARNRNCTCAPTAPRSTRRRRSHGGRGARRHPADRLRVGSGGPPLTAARRPCPSGIPFPCQPRCAACTRASDFSTTPKNARSHGHPVSSPSRRPLPQHARMPPRRALHDAASTDVPPSPPSRTAPAPRARYAAAARRDRRRAWR